MNKVSYLYYYLANPGFATVVTIFIISLFFVVYSIQLNKKTRNYNSFLRALNKDAGGLIVLIPCIVTGVILFFSNLIVLSSYIDKKTVEPYPEFYIYIYLPIYALIPIVISFFIIQPRISEKFNLKRKRKRLLTEISDVLNQYIITVASYQGGYQGLTKVELSNIITSFDVLKTKISTEANIKNPKIYNLYSSIERIESLSKDISKVYDKFNEFQLKENAVYESINHLESQIRFESKSGKQHLQEQYDYLQEFVSIDILKAYNFIQKQNINPSLRAKKNAVDYIWSN